jgi:hypothetical protein
VLLSALLVKSSPIFNFLRKNKGKQIEKGSKAREEENTITPDEECLPNTEQMDKVLVLGRSMLKNYDPSIVGSYPSISLSHYKILVCYVSLISVEEI